MIKTHHMLYCDGEGCPDSYEAENPDCEPGETPTEVRERAAKRSGFVRRKDPKTGRMGDFCSACDPTALK